MPPDVDQLQTYQFAALAAIGLVTAVFGWYHSKRIGVAAAQKAADEAHRNTIEAQAAHISAAQGRLRLLEDVIESDQRSDLHREHELEQCRKERDRERRLYEAAVEQFEWLQAAVWSEDAEPPTLVTG